MEKFNQTIKSLKELHELQRNRKLCYTKAKEDLTKWDFDLSIVFDAIINQCQDQQKELSTLLKQQGEFEIRQETTFLSELNKMWIEVKSLVSKRERKVILASCLYGEQTIIKAYENKITQDYFPENIQIALERQLNQIKNAQQSLKDVKRKSLNRNQFDLEIFSIFTNS